MNKKSYLSLIAIMLCALIPSQGASTVNDSLFSSVKDNLVLIETDVANGSGFICGSWLITNEHVIRDAKNIVARYLSGGLVKFAHPKEAAVEQNRNAAKQKAAGSGAFDDICLEVARDRDLARIMIHASSGGLSIAEGVVDIGRTVYTFGNSDGSGVVTSLRGKIVGIGPDRIEVDIPFVQGNSGGAIIAEDGTVCGVATYATINSDPDNWLKKGTRFNKVRRFGLTLNDVRWVRLSWADYVGRCRKLKEIRAVNDFLYLAALKPWPLECFSHTTIHSSSPMVIGNGFFSRGYDSTSHIYEHPGKAKLKEMANQKKKEYEGIIGQSRGYRNLAYKICDADLQFALAIDKAMEIKQEERFGRRSIGGDSKSRINTAKKRGKDMLSARIKMANTMHNELAKYKPGVWMAYNLEGDFLLEKRLLEKIRDFFTSQEGEWENECIRATGM